MSSPSIRDVLAIDNINNDNEPKVPELLPCRNDDNDYRGIQGILWFNLFVCFLQRHINGGLRYCLCSGL